MGQGRIVATASRLEEVPHGLRSLGVAEAEVVEEGHAFGIGTDGDGVPHGLVDGRDGGPIGIEPAVARIEAIRKG